MDYMNGTELKALRLALGLNVQEVTKIMYVTRQNIYNIESGNCLKKSSLRYYAMTLKEIASEKQLSDEEIEERTNLIKQLTKCGAYPRFYSK